jgi:hypothetical protein
VYYITASKEKKYTLQRNEEEENIMGRTMNKFTKLVLSFLMVITCVNLSSIQAEDGSVGGTDEQVIEMQSDDAAAQDETGETQSVVDDTTSDSEQSDAADQQVETPSETETTIVTEGNASDNQNEVTTQETITTEGASEETTANVETTEESEENNAVDFDNMTADELFDYLMNNVSSMDEVNALINEHPTLEGLMESFTEEQNTELEEKFGGNSEADIETADRNGGYNTATFNVSLESSQLAYFAWHTSSDTNSVSFTSVTSGSLSIDNFNSSDSWGGTAGYVLFVAKATDDQHLITGMNADGDGDVYPINTTETIDWSKTRINYPGLSKVIAAAKEAGYTVAFGYMRTAGQQAPTNMGITVNGYNPGVEVAASTNNVGVKPDDTVTFNVVVTPGLGDTGRLSVTNMSVTSATINGNAVTVPTLTKQNDGTYTGTITYKVTESDCEKNTVELVVNTSTTYQAKVNPTGDGKPLYTTKTISGSATTNASIATKSLITYEFVSGTTGKTLPSEVTALIPRETVKHYSGDTVTPKQPQTTTGDVVTRVDVENGYWEFQGWDAESKTMTDKGITFTGTWIYKDYVSITAKAKSASYEYDGTENSIKANVLENSTVTVDGETYTITAITSGASGTNVKVEGGKVVGYANTITKDSVVVKDSKGNDVTNNCKITTEDGSLTITKRVVKLKSESASKKYDGTALTATKVTYEDNTSFVTGEVSKVVAIGHITNVAKDSSGKVTGVENTIQYTPVQDKFINNNYDIQVDEGTLTIQPITDNVEVSIIGATGTFSYDGSSHTVKGYTAKANNDLYITTGENRFFTCTNESDATVTKTDVNPDRDASGAVVGYVMGLKTSWFKNVSYNFTNVTFSIKDGNIKITPATLTVTTPSESKTYDGTALTAAGQISGFVNNETATFTTTGSQTDKGFSSNTYSLKWDGTAKSTNYTVSETLGTLTVRSQSITPGTDPENPDEDYKGVTVSDLQDVVYNGKKQKQTPEVKDANGNDLKKGTDYSVSYSKDTKNACEVTVTITGKGNYSGTVKKTYKITQAPLTVVTASDEKVYDGTALTKTNEYTFDGLVNNETAGFTVTGTQTKVGSSSNTYTITWKAKNNKYKAVASNYYIESEQLGTLVVKESEQEIVVTTTGGTYTYDGNAHGATVTVGTLPTGYHVEGTPTSNTTATDVNGDGVLATCDSLVIKNAENEDVTSKLKITKVDGTIKITPATLTVTTPSESKTYDGTALTSAGTISGFVNNETATFTTTGSQTNKGSSSNTYSLTWDGTAKSTNYTVSETLGTLTVVAKNITPDETDTPEESKTGITVTNPENHEYDGEDHKEVLEVTDTKVNKTLVEGTDYTVTYLRDSEITEDFKNVGTITIKVNGTGNYTGKFTKTYEITRKEVKVTAEDKSKVYGSTDPELTATTDGTVGTDTVTYTLSRAEGENVAEYTITPAGDASQGNYTVEYVNGTFTITSKDITPDTPDTSDEDKTGIEVNEVENHVYDGTEHKETLTVTDTKTDNELVEGEDYDVTYDTEDFTNVGKITITVTGKGNYTGSFTKSYEITKAPLTITTDSASKNYDGSALTATGKIEGLVNGETVTFTVTGTITDEGEVQNTYSLTWDGTAKEGNYEVTENLGTLKIEAAAPVVTPETTPTPEATTTPTTPAPVTPVTPARRVTPVTPATPESTETPEATEEPEVTPTPSATPTATPETIDDDSTPEVAPKAQWALINLIAAMLSVLLGVIVILSKHSEDEEDEDDDQVVESEEDDKKSTRHRRWKVIAGIDAIASVVVFILTENITNQMVLVDKWTILMVAFALIAVVSTYFGRKWHEDKEDEDSSENA